MQKEIVQCIRRAALSLQREGATVDFEFDKPVDFEQSHELYMRTLKRANAAGASKVPFGKHWKNQNKRAKLKAKWAKLFEVYDVLLCPVAFSVAFAHNQDTPMVARTIRVDGEDRGYMDMLTWSGLTILPDLPVTAVPIGQTTRGLPIGVQIVSAFLNDLTTLSVGKAIERFHYAFQPPPQLERRLSQVSKM